MKKFFKNAIKSKKHRGQAPVSSVESHSTMQTGEANTSHLGVQGPPPDLPMQAHTVVQTVEAGSGDLEVRDMTLDPQGKTHVVTQAAGADTGNLEVHDPTSGPLMQTERVVQPAEEVMSHLQVPEDPEIIKIKKKCPRFRILIIGRANSGKTTILQKMCGTTDTPIVRDRYGNEIDPSILENPTAMRGMHDIENEITYPSNPNFVFHDSMGFEAGSVGELEKVKNFVNQRSEENELKDRLHVIWYCIPMDGDRVLSTAERSFFEHGTDAVPVIALFTKWDGQVSKAFNKLYDSGTTGMNPRDAKKQAPEYAKRTFQDHYLPVVRDAAHPPTGYVLLGNMHEPETSCSELTEKTEAAMNSDLLKKLFVSVQQTNIQLTMKYAVRYGIHNFLPASWPSRYCTREDLLYLPLWLCPWFGHLIGASESYEKKPDPLAGDGTGNYYEERDAAYAQLLDVIKASWSISDDSELLLTFTAAIVLGAHRTSILNHTEPNQLRAAVIEYGESSKAITIKEAIGKMVQAHQSQLSQNPGYSCNPEAVADDLLRICLENILG